VSIRDGKIHAMRQYRSRTHALTAVQFASELLADVLVGDERLVRAGRSAEDG
jgi:hypothetical protein